MKTKNTKSLLILSSLLTLLSGCEIGDNQLLVPQDRQSVANPEATTRDFKAINERHKILMAIVDYGVDYNQPELIKNMHFSLDQNNRPIGLGHDYVGNDNWPSPYLATTADVDPDSPETAKKNANELTKHLQMLLSAHPELEGMISPYQRIDQESDTGSFHGTHVAGLMTYDAPEIGLISYRVLPINTYYKAGEIEREKMGEVPVSNDVLNALNLAAQNGVKVVNLSLATSLKMNETPKGTKEYEDYFSIYKKVSEFIKQHPEITFVAAAGNSGYFIDDKNYKQLPCGIDAPNILCVGVLDKNGKRADFSNVTMKSAFILAPGIDILSTIPKKTCRLIDDGNTITESTDLILDETNSPWNNSDETKKFLDQIAGRCLSNKGFLKLSGSSMSSPIIARAIAKLRLKYPNLNGEDSIKKLLSMGEEIKEGKFTFKRIRVEKPSWYNRSVNLEKLSDPFMVDQKISPLSTKEYFEFKGL